MLGLLSLGKSANEAVSFVTGESFLAALDAIGGVHTQAAQDAFRKVPQSQNPREAMNRALCHLEAAHVAFRGSWSSMARYLRPIRGMIQAGKDVNTCCFIALIHRLLGDDDRLVIQAIRLAEEAFAVEMPATSKSPLVLLEVVVALANPLTLIDCIYDQFQYERALEKQGISGERLKELVTHANEIRRSDFEGFKKLILDSLSGQAADAKGIK